MRLVSQSARSAAQFVKSEVQFTQIGCCDQGVRRYWEALISPFAIVSLVLSVVNPWRTAEVLNRSRKALADASASVPHAVPAPRPVPPRPTGHRVR